MFHCGGHSCTRERERIYYALLFKQEKLVYAPGENDMVVMQHGFGIETKNGNFSNNFWYL